MKYISLLHVIGNYGEAVRSCHNMHAIPSALSNKQYNASVDLKPFDIDTSTEPETGQVTNTVRVRDHIDRTAAFTRAMPPSLPFYPFLELEWLRQKMPLSDIQYNVLMQLSFMYVIQVIVFKQKNDINLNTDSWLAYLERHEMVVEVEELEDTPVILQTCVFPDVEKPKIRSWSTLLLYGNDFQQLFGRCNDQSSSFKEFYYHMPVLLSMFMVDYYGSNLENWSKELRIEAESTIREAINGFTRYVVTPGAGDTFTYGITMNITQADVTLVSTMFTIIMEMITDMNADMGLISYYSYCNIRGPERIRASVRLTNMDINWCEEMDRADKEKAALAAENASVDGEQEDEV